MSDWIVQYVRTGSAGSWAADRASVSKRVRRGIEELSALNLVLQLGQQRWFAQNHELNVLGYSDQRYIMAAAARRCPKRSPRRCRPGASASASGLLRSGRRERSLCADFTKDGMREMFLADRVVLALPFIALRAVDYSSAVSSRGRSMRSKISATVSIRNSICSSTGVPGCAPASMARTDDWADLDDLPRAERADYSLGQRAADA